MSTRENRKQSRRTDHPVWNESRRSQIPTVDIASYAVDMIKGVRTLTKRPNQKDLTFLDKLLAMAEEEAANLSSHSYH